VDDGRRSGGTKGFIIVLKSLASYFTTLIPLAASVGILPPRLLSSKQDLQ